MNEIFYKNHYLDESAFISVDPVLLHEFPTFIYVSISLIFLHTIIFKSLIKTPFIIKFY